MITTASIPEIRAIRWEDPTATWGFVPTMGYLHEGHISLVKEAKANNDKVAVSIYVNPTQFAEGEDLSSYPTNIERDTQMLLDAGVDLLFLPNNQVMYPDGYQTTVTVSEVTQLLEGASRPEHFEGVTTIVTKLFNIIQPTRAYFGQKDAQQTVVLQQMVQDLNMNLEMVICPIVREADGLAMSSRNSYLTAEQREGAVVLSRSLRLAQERLNEGEQSAEILRTLITETIASEPVATLEYVSIANATTLQEIEQVNGRCLISMAAQVGSTRLIDNLLWPDLPLT